MWPRGQTWTMESFHLAHYATGRPGNLEAWLTRGRVPGPHWKWLLPEWGTHHQHSPTQPAAVCPTAFITSHATVATCPAATASTTTAPLTCLVRSLTVQTQPVIQGKFDTHTVTNYPNAMICS